MQGIIINGCIRDSEDIGKMPLGVKALATYPLKSSKRDPGLSDVPVCFGGANFKPGARTVWEYACVFCGQHDGVEALSMGRCRTEHNSGGQRHPLSPVITLLSPSLPCHRPLACWMAGGRAAGDYVYADKDGILVAPDELKL